MFINKSKIRERYEGFALKMQVLQNACFVFQAEKPIMILEHSYVSSPNTTFGGGLHISILKTDKSTEVRQALLKSILTLFTYADDTNIDRVRFFTQSTKH